MNNTNIEDPILNYILNEHKEMLLKVPDITEEDILYSLECQKEVYKPKLFIQKFFSNNYKLIKIYYRFITSCYNETYYLLYNEENKDIVLIKDRHSCFGAKKGEYPKISHLENLFQSFFNIKNNLEKAQLKTFENDEYKFPYDTKFDYEFKKLQSINFCEKELEEIQKFIDIYLKILKERYL